MALRDILKKIASEKNIPCVTISLNTHRTYPDNQMDEIVLKNLLKEAEKRVTSEFGKRRIAPLLEKLQSLADNADLSNSLDSLHIFLSNDTKEMVKITWPIYENKVHIAETFDVRPLIKAYNRSEKYLILLLSQGGVRLYLALDDCMEHEIENDDFPFPANPYYVQEPKRRSDARLMDDMVREFFNQVDKALIKVNRETLLPTIVICTEDNYSKLMQVAGIPGIYTGYSAIDYNNIRPHQLAQQALKMIRQQQHQRRAEAITEMRNAIADNKVITDLQEIYQAAMDGRGDLLIVRDDFEQPVRMTDNRTFDIVTDPDAPNVIDDITSDIAWEVLSKKGRAYFTLQEEIRELGDIALKTRY